MSSASGMMRRGPGGKFRAPIPPGMTLAEAARRIEAEYAPALAALRDEVGAAFGIPPNMLPLAWFVEGGMVRCASCRTDVQVELTLLRCGDCGRAATKPMWWSP